MKPTSNELMTHRKKKKKIVSNLGNNVQYWELVVLACLALGFGILGFCIGVITLHVMIFVFVYRIFFLRFLLNYGGIIRWSHHEMVFWSFFCFFVLSYCLAYDIIIHTTLLITIVVCSL